MKPMRSTMSTALAVALLAGACGVVGADPTTQSPTEQTTAAPTAATPATIATTTTSMTTTSTAAAALATDDGDPCLAPAEERAETVSIPYGGLDREYHIVVPAGAGPFPVVMAFHGYAQSAQSHEEMTGLGDEALGRGFIAVFPEGTIPPDGTQTYFNIETTSDESLPDDVGFAAAILDEVESQYCVDEGRVYASGWSNGGMLSSVIACEIGDRFAAVGGVSGVILPDDCPNTVPIVILHGMGDSIVPFDGANSGDVATTLTNFGASPTQVEMFTPLLNPAEYIDMWVEHNGCAEDAVSAEAETGLEISDYQGCDVDVETVILDGGDHRWIEYPTEYVLDFFFDHKL